MKYDDLNLRTWGYYLIRAGAIGFPEFAGCQLNAGNGGAVIPDYSNIPNGQRTFDAAASAGRMQVPEAAAREIYQYNCDVFARGKLIYFHPRFTDMADALELKQRFFAADDSWSVIGVGFLNPELAEIAGYRELSPLAPGGIGLGYDVYQFCFNGGHPKDFSADDVSIGCPFRHSDTDNQIAAKLGIALTSYGLLPDAASAQRLAGHVNEYELGEPGYYLALALVRY